MKIVRVALEAAPRALPGVAEFYRDRLRLDVTETHGSIVVEVGATAIAFEPASGSEEPFYHFALRIPRDRFDAARAWLDERAGLLPDLDTGDTTFRFESWNADACYAQDPAGNVVELIAHHELPDESGETGAFAGRELLGVCEVGLVGEDIAAMARPLIDAGIELWDGTLDNPDGLAFMGGRDGVLILAREGRPWMPTDRRSERNAIDVVVRGRRGAEVVVADSTHRIRVTQEPAE